MTTKEVLKKSEDGFLTHSRDVKGFSKDLTKTPDGYFIADPARRIGTPGTSLKTPGRRRPSSAATPATPLFSKTMEKETPAKFPPMKFGNTAGRPSMSATKQPPPASVRKSVVPTLAKAPQPQAQPRKSIPASKPTTLTEHAKMAPKQGEKKEKQKAIAVVMEETPIEVKLVEKAPETPIAVLVEPPAPVEVPEKRKSMQDVAPVMEPMEVIAPVEPASIVSPVVPVAETAAPVEILEKRKSKRKSMKGVTPVMELKPMEVVEGTPPVSIQEEDAELGPPKAKKRKNKAAYRRFGC